MKKELKYLVIHCTATPENRDVTAADIKAWHTAPPPKGNGWKTPGYTDVFRLSGKVERMVDNNEDEFVDPWEMTNGAKGYNSQSRHIVYVGGCDKAMKSKDTRTAAQKEAMKKYVLDFHKKYPKVKILGHGDLPGVAKDCPSFNVAAWLREIGIR